ncbi:fibronectin type III domain-containing protein [Hymenobacter monticola]|uniref:Fibronectin type III domain-containing protein n=1 Tax=Hymenobacter monticola TaxID=1705399 RepID=A0ABY4BCJ5_9BACT|nr:fibronectin type III domain-containing protein [Hymenobacter monticola]UOE35726.1 fibronectin type III domain-containing protein [Hymenobacter monticola]
MRNFLQARRPARPRPVSFRTGRLLVLALLVLLLCSTGARAQVFTIGTNATTCSGTIYDSGGASGNYQNNESLTSVLTPATAGSRVQLVFSSFSTEGAVDFLRIYDGPTTSAPLIGSHSSTNSPGTVTATNSTGQLTLVFSSNASIVSTGFAASIACVAPPACAAPTLTAVSAITTTSANVEFTGGNGNTSYTVNYTPTGGTAQMTTGAASPIALTGLTPGTQYSVTVTGNCSGGLTATSPLVGSFQTLPSVPANDECAGAVSLASNVACSRTTGSTLGATASTAAGSCGGTADDDVWYSFVATNTTHTVTVTGNMTFDAVLDLRDGACPGTTVACADATPRGGVETITATGLSVGATYYVRVYSFSSFPPTSSSNGGFTICVTNPPVCPAPAALSTNSVTNTSANVTFSASAASYTVTYTPTGGTATTVTPAPTASPVALTGLTPSTTYTVSVVANCTGGLTSTAATTTFTTLAMANDVCSGAVALSCGQSVTGTTVGATTAGDPTGTCGGAFANRAGVFYSFVGTGDIVTVNACTTLQAFTGNTKVFVYSGTCGALTCVDGNDDQLTCLTNGVASQVTFPSVAGTNYFIFVQGVSGSPRFTLTLTCTSPVCNAPTALTINNLTQNSANVSFTAGTGNTSFTATLTPQGGTGTTAPVSSPFSLMGLAPNTTYTLSLQAACAGSGTTAAVTTTFTTPAAPLTDLTVANGQNLTASGPYNNITVQNGGTLTFTGPTSAAGAVQVQTGGVLITNCQPLTGSGSFALQTGAELRICDATGITTAGATGAIQLTGTRSYASDASYTYNGTAAQVTGAGLPAAVRNLTVNNPAGLTLSQGVSIAQVARLQSGNLATSGQAFTLLSSVNGTALIDNSGGVVTGTGTMQRYLDNRNAISYRHYSAPVSNTTLGDLTTSSFTPQFNTTYNTSAAPSLVTPFPTVFGYDQNRVSTVTSTYVGFDKGWFSPAGPGDAMQPTRGYTVNAPSSALIDFVGSFNTGTQNSGTLARGTDARAGWQLLGNPYPSPLDWSTVAPAQRPGMDAAVYLFQSSGQYSGTYRSYTNGIGSGSPIIPAGSGYFVRVTTPGTSGEVNLTNSNRVTTYGSQPPFGRSMADTRPQLQLRLAGAGLADETFLYLEAGATANVDAQYDATKLANPAGLDLASLAGTTQLAINGLAPLSTTDVVVPLALRVPQAGSFSFEVADLANFGTATVYLRDALTGTQQLLTTGTRYTFALVTAGTGRFSVVFRAAGVLATTAPLNAAAVSLYPNPAHANFTVLLPPLPGQREVHATLLNALGQVVASRSIGLTAAGATATFDTRLLATGVYMLRLQAGQHVLVKRVAIE